MFDNIFHWPAKKKEHVFKLFEQLINAQHKLNLELDVDEILDLNEDAYIELCKFIKVKPLMNWRDYINEYKDYVKIGRTL